MAKPEPRTKLPMTFYVVTIGPFGAELSKDKPEGLPTRRVRVTDAACPVAKAERVVVKAAEALCQTQGMHGITVVQVRGDLEAAVDALRAAKRRRP